MNQAFSKCAGLSPSSSLMRCMKITNLEGLDYGTDSYAQVKDLLILRGARASPHIGPSVRSVFHVFQVGLGFRNSGLRSYSRGRSFQTSQRQNGHKGMVAYVLERRPAGGRWASGTSGQARCFNLESYEPQG